MINALENALSGLLAARKRIDISAQNIANADSRGAREEVQAPGAYQAQKAIQTPLIDADGNVIGTQVSSENRSPATRPVYEPQSPLSDEQGYVEKPSVDFVEEALNISLSQMSFEANALIVSAVQDLSLATSRLFQSGR